MKVMKRLCGAACLLAGFALCSAGAFHYSVLTHEAIVDTAGGTSFQKLLLKRFPTATPEELVGTLGLPNRNFDAGDLTRSGAYQGADEAYAKLMGKPTDHKFSGMAPELRSNILTFYAGAAAPEHAKTPKQAAKEIA